jgi:nucleotide-binding universal stress UspA family protein
VTPVSHPITFTPPVEGGIVVGVDGSQPGLRALEWAWREASVRRVPLHVVRAWSIATAVPEVGAPPGVVPSLAECAQVVESETAQAVNRMRADAGLDDDARPELHLHVVHAPAGAALVAATEAADLVVVGHHGHHRLALMLGSVAAHVVEHSRCPVVVIPEPRKPAPHP